MRNAALILVSFLALVCAVRADDGVIPIGIDIKPGSDPNSLNVHSKGVLPVAILGTAEFDVTMVDPGTLRLYWIGISLPVGTAAGAGAGGAIPLRWALEDVNGDGWLDLGLKFGVEEFKPLTLTHEAPGELTMTLEGSLLRKSGGHIIRGEDTLFVINKRREGRQPK